MPEWLRDSLANGDPLPPTPVLVGRLAVALVLGFVVAGVYGAWLGRQRDEVRTLPTTLVLLAVLITLVTMVIGNSVARAFGLVGALSIVRFRTVVEDTRDTAFVIFAVAVGMAVGAGYTALAALGIPVVAAAAAVMARIDRPREIPGRPATLIIRIGLGYDPDSLLGAVLGKHLDTIRLVAVGTARQGAAVELTYTVRLRGSETAFPLVAELNRVEGVQSVEVREQPT
jgi:MFS family permease